MASRYGLEIRAADGADAPGLAELLQAAGFPAAPAAVAGRLERLRAARATVLLAVEWGPPSGVVVLHPLQTLEADPPLGVVSALLVAPEARRRGIGRLLLKAVSQAARSAGCGDIRLPAAADHAGLRDFLLATGFTETDAGFSRPLRKRG